MGPRSSYVERFQRIVEELERHPAVTVHHSHVAPPVDDATIEHVQSELGLPLSEEVLSFYRQANGLELVWFPCSGIEGHQYEKRALAKPFERMRTSHAGLINVRPLETLISKAPRWLRRNARPFDAYSRETLVAFELPRAATNQAWARRLRVHQDVQHEKLSPDDWEPIEFWTYLEGLLTTYGSCRARRRALLVVSGGDEPRDSEAGALETLLLECRLSEERWYDFNPTPIMPIEFFDFGEGPRLGDDVVFLCPFSMVPKQVEGLPAHMAAWVMVYGGGEAIRALVRDHPDRETSDEVRALEAQMTWSMFLFMVVEGYRPNVRVPRDAHDHIQQNLSLEETKAYFEARGVRVLTLDDVGLIHDPERVCSRTDFVPAGVRVEEVKPLHREWLAHRRRLLGLLADRARRG